MFDGGCPIQRFVSTSAIAMMTIHLDDAASGC